MALIVSAASGNFNAGATWVGGVVPTVGDEARASTGHTITISANATCDEISNAGTGTFILNNGVTLTANTTAKTTTSGVVLLTYSGNTSAAIVGNITGNTNAGLAGTNRCVQHTGSGTLNITGNCSSSGASNSNAVVNISVGTINIVGNVSAGGNSSQFAGPAVVNNSTGIITVTGNVTASDSANTSVGLNNTATGTVTVIGTITAAQSNAGIQNTSTGPLILTGPFIMANNGRLAVSASFWRWASTIVSSTYFQIPTSNLLSTRNLVTADNITGMPAAINVKSGIAYGPSNELTGTFAQTVTPSTADIATAVWGAATRSITGGTVDTLTNAPASVTPSDIWSHASRTLTSASGPTAVEIRQEMDSNSTKLSNLDATVSSRLASSGYTAPTSAPSVADIRTELAVELGRLDASVSSRLAGSAYTAPTTPPTAAQIATAVEGSLLNESDGQAVLNAIVGAIGNTNLSEVSLVAAVRADLERTGGKLDNIPTTSAPSASAVAGAVRTELGVELGRLDASVSSRLSPSGTLATVTNLTNAPASVTPSDIWSHATRTLTTSSGPTAVQIRQEIDANSTKLDAAISSRMAASEATKLDSIKGKTDLLNTDRLANVATTNIVGTLLAQANS